MEKLFLTCTVESNITFLKLNSSRISTSTTAHTRTWMSAYPHADCLQTARARLKNHKKRLEGNFPVDHLEKEEAKLKNLFECYYVCEQI